MASFCEYNFLRNWNGCGSEFIVASGKEKKIVKHSSKWDNAAITRTSHFAHKSKKDKGLVQ